MYWGVGCLVGSGGCVGVLKWGWGIVGFLELCDVGSVQEVVWVWGRIVGRGGRGGFLQMCRAKWAK